MKRLNLLSSDTVSKRAIERKLYNVLLKCTTCERETEVFTLMPTPEEALESLPKKDINGWLLDDDFVICPVCRLKLKETIIL